ncbi:MAG: InlB B-repeat-containing protein, partial [Nitrososphaerota archaeon]|nr:InlB B-repeat-containing protein [Nitrososphaerota archaeon]
MAIATILILLFSFAQSLPQASAADTPYEPFFHTYPFGVNDEIIYEITYTLPNDISPIMTFKILDAWTPITGLAFVDCIILIDSVDVTSNVTVLSGTGQVSFEFTPDLLVADATVMVMLTFTVLDVTGGISNTATVIVNGHSVGTDKADLHRVTYTANDAGVVGSVPVDAVLYKSGVAVVVLGNTGGLTLAGYKFIGWLYNGRVYNEGETFIIGEDAVLSAQWGLDESSYTIHYEMTGGVNIAGNPSSYTASSLPLSIADPFKLGYGFLGWTVVYSDGTPAVTNPQSSYSVPVGITGDIVLTAVWSSATTYTIHYELNGGTNAPDNPTTYTVEDTFPINIANPNRTGHSFFGWMVKYVDGSQADITAPTISYSIPEGTTGDIVLTANWNIFQLMVRFVDWNGVLLKSEVVSYGGSAVAPVSPFRLGYVFS